MTCSGAPRAAACRGFDGDDELVALGSLGHHHVSLLVQRAGHADALALAEGVEMQALVLAEHPALQIHDRTRSVGHEGAQKVLHLHLADEADALAVLLLRRLQPSSRASARSSGLSSGRWESARCAPAPGASSPGSRSGPCSGPHRERMPGRHLSLARIVTGGDGVKPRSRAQSQSTPNFISRLHITSGFGVTPSW
jgi:hypothetical protein